MQKICLILDCPPASHTPHRLMEQLGFDVIMAQRGEDAFAVCQVRRPDLIWINLYQPEVQGMGFLRCYRPHRGMSTKIVVVAADDTGWLCARQYGADGRIDALYDFTMVQSCLRGIGFKI